MNSENLKQNAERSQRGRQIAEALNSLVEGRDTLGQIDLRKCNNDLRAHIREAQESIKAGAKSLEDALRDHLRQEARKATS